MLLKFGVDISRLSDPVRRALNVVEAAHAVNGFEAVVTSTYEGTHSPASLHYVNRAFDYRKIGPVELIANKIRADLGPAFDVVVESNHVHVEHDPKENA
jgi:hypothetical protein